MSNFRFAAAGIFLIFILSCSSSNGQDDQPKFWDGKNALLRGMSLGNGVWYLAESEDLQTESDYAEMKSLGLNAVRFYLSYKFFENDNEEITQYKQEGWDFLERNLEWARGKNIKLILNMHFPQGGFQSNGDGGELWTNVENQNRLTALWYEIAKRYASDTTVAAYDLVNEPVIVGDKSVWQKLAQRLADTIRTVDVERLILVERVNGFIKENGELDYSSDAEKNFVFINDKKWGLTFHFYEPIEYTHQYASWTGFANTDGGKYPDSTSLQIYNAQWKGATFNNPTIQSGDSDWKYYEGKWVNVGDSVNVGRPTLMCQNAGVGKVWFDSLVVEKKNEAGEISVVATYDLPMTGDWYFWEDKAGGSAGADGEQILITGTISDANYASSNMYFPFEKGYSYRAGGKMKGEGVPSGAACRIRLDFSFAEKTQVRDRKFLEDIIDEYQKIATEKNLPIFMGEFGVIKFTFENDRGGLNWVADMLSILKERGISFTYHAWYDDSFGVRDNAALKEEFGKKFRSRSP
ncbi:hypothetical protein AGMMS49938_00930 [Fibrobacterales bacterium]|nr:hypothetical protein AGMMS49938_00930 [Fibrobacterales bacterium]